MSNSPDIPFSEILKSVPEFFGIRLNEEPQYDVVDRFDGDDVEVRRYKRCVIAEVTVTGAYKPAVEEAFNRLAKYIFGENSKRENLPMTAPVLQVESGPHLAMTSPVIQQQDGSAWTLKFFLSNDLDLARAPVPRDSAIQVSTAPERLVAVTRYRGNNTEPKRNEARERLLAWIERNGTYGADGSVYWAQYDAPFVLPFVKKNEAQIEVVRRQ